jgi:PhnB protein
MAEPRSGLVPYLFYDDAGLMADWYGKVFGFEELSRYTEQSGRVTNAEMRVGDTELWMDGNGSAYWERTGAKPGGWIGVWVDDPDAVYERIKSCGVGLDPPEDKPYGVRMTGNVTDPAGYQWGFMARISKAAP